MSDKARFAAYNAVKRIFGGAYSNLIEFGDDLKGIDRSFTESITLGTLERKLTLEFVLNDFIKGNTKSDVKILLMTGIYQILYMDRVPDNAVCDETVKIAKSLFGKNVSGFVNAVLRNVCRNRANILSNIEQADEHIKYSVNEELFALIKSQYPDEFKRIFEAFFGKTENALRVNTIKTDAETVAKATNGVALSEKTVICDSIANALNNIENGQFYIQGLASQKAVEWLDAQSGHTVIDVCACPGGKSLGAALDMKNVGKIYSFDIHEKKLPLIEKSAERLGITIITTAKQDGRKAREDLIGTADRVICDVPCSGTGVMGSKPEIKYKSPEEFKGLYPTQASIIESASKYLKNGGIMVYSTCSINKIENEDTVKEFLNNNDGYRLISDKTCLPFGNEKEGFYMAKIIREK